MRLLSFVYELPWEMVFVLFLIGGWSSCVVQQPEGVVAKQLMVGACYLSSVADIGPISAWLLGHQCKAVGL